MTNYDREPEIRVRIHTAGAPLLSPRGMYEITSRGRMVVYRPLEQGAMMALENQAIGVGFHWSRQIGTLIEGSFEVDRDSKTLYNLLPLERYLMCVNGSEMNPSAPAEFLKAHAVIARSWALAGMGRRHDDCDVCSDDCCQRYQGVPATADDNKAARAVADTRGLVIVDAHGEIADARYSKSCGGHTELFSTCWEDTDYEYLPAQRDPWCSCADMPEDDKEEFARQVFKDYDRSTAMLDSWAASIDAGEIRERVAKIYHKDIGDVSSLRALRRGPSGRISLLRVTGERGSIDVGKELAVRRLLGKPCLFSSALDISREGNIFYFAGRGWGHGVGLCQTGAARMALNGKSFTDILNFYYPNTKLLKIYE